MSEINLLAKITKCKICTAQWQTVETPIFSFFFFCRLCQEIFVVIWTKLRTFNTFVHTRSRTTIGLFYIHAILGTRHMVKTRQLIAESELCRVVKMEKIFDGVWTSSLEVASPHWMTMGHLMRWRLLIEWSTVYRVTPLDVRRTVWSVHQNFSCQNE